MVQLLERVTGPILYPLQRIIPPLGGIDLSPLVAMLLIELIKGLLVNAILKLGG
ncbi:MAG: YggT family protein [Acidithiobacillus sp.]